MFNGWVCGGEAVVNGVGEFGKDRGEETDWDREGVGGSFESGYGFTWFKEGGAGGAEKDLWPYGDVVVP
jgi:hypothetical protein